MTDVDTYKPETTKYGLMEKFRVEVEFHLTIIQSIRAPPYQYNQPFQGLTLMADLTAKNGEIEISDSMVI